MTLQQYLDGLASQLGDFDASDAGSSYVHWSRDTLLNWFNEAHCLVATYCPQDFVTTKIVKLQPGTSQFPCCKHTGSAIEFVNAGGGHISYLTTLTAKTASKPWRGAACFSKSSLSYKPKTTWKMDAGSDSFEVYPPVPANGDYYIKIRCVQQPAALDVGNFADELDCRYTGAISEWVMYKALSGENDSQLIPSAQMHYKAFFDILKIKVQALRDFDKSANNWTNVSNFANEVNVK